MRQPKARSDSGARRPRERGGGREPRARVQRRATSSRFLPFLLFHAIWLFAGGLQAQATIFFADLGSTDPSEPSPNPNRSFSEVPIGNNPRKPVALLYLWGYHDDPATVAYWTEPLSATEDVDYVGVSGSFTFQAGSRVGAFLVEVEFIDDAVAEADESFQLHIDVVRGAVLAGRSFATITIQDDDSLAPGTADLAVEICGTRFANVANGLPFRAFTATITNRGPETATDVVLHQAPTDLEASTSQGSCDRGPDSGPFPTTCAIGSLAPGATATVDMSGIFQESSKGVRIKRVSVDSDLPDANPSNNQASMSTTLVNCAGLEQACPIAEMIDDAICEGRVGASSSCRTDASRRAPRGSLWSRARAALERVAPPLVVELLGEVAGIDLDVFHRLREEVFPTTPMGRRYIELYESHGPEISMLLLTHPALARRSRDALVLWQNDLRSLLEGRGAGASITAQQIAEAEGVLDEIANLGSAELRSAIERERSLLDIDSFVGRDMAQAQALAQQPGCAGAETTLCLGNGRFRATVTWRDFQGNTGVGRAVPLTDDTGHFWFFEPENVELVVKVLDGSGVNDRFWVYYGALSNVEYTLSVEDTVSGEVRTYQNPLGNLASAADVSAFAGGGGTPPPAAPPPSPSRCSAEGDRLCLTGNRFEVEVTWRDFQGKSGAGQAVDLTPDTGYFWFFGPQNVELVIKVLDARLINGRFWVFYGALSNVEYTITVRDRNTGAIRTYANPSGQLASFADTTAF